MTEAAAVSPAVPGHRLADAALAVLIGVGAFLVVVGPKVLDVTNMAWLATEKDSYTHYLGWAFFRQSPWTWPPGLNPDYGLEISSSIIFSDSIPLVALPLKLFAPLMPEVFQFTGWWILACLMLQAFFAVRIAGLLSRSAAVKIGFAVLLVFAPPMLWRLSVHFSLIAHWLILAAIYLIWAPAGRWRWLAWTALLCACALIHTYFLAMCALLWCTDLVRQRRGKGTLPWPIEVIIVLAGSVAALWLGGFFPLRPTMLSFGYGVFRLNLLSPVNPDGGVQVDHPWPWSSLLPTLPHTPGDYEGFAYFGAGGLLLIVYALPLVWVKRRSYAGARLWAPIVAAVLLTLFAISPNVTFGAHTLQVPAPLALIELANTLRSSGRFFWPVFYLVLAGAAWLLHRALGPRILGPALLLVAMLQVYDTAPGWSVLRARFQIAGSTSPATVADARVDAMVAHYRAVRVLPPGTRSEQWEAAADLALRHHLPTDAAYLARSDDENYVAATSWKIAGHRLDPKALYLLDADMARAVAATEQPDDRMFEVGGLYVFAPDWAVLGATTTLSLYRGGRQP